MFNCSGWYEVDTKYYKIIFPTLIYYFVFFFIVIHTLNKLQKLRQIMKIKIWKSKNYFPTIDKNVNDFEYK